MEIVKPVIRINKERPVNASIEVDPICYGDVYLEVDGKQVTNQMSVGITSNPGEVATLTVVFQLPEIKYKGE